VIFCGLCIGLESPEPFGPLLATELQEPRCGTRLQGLGMFTNSTRLAILATLAALNAPSLAAAEYNPAARTPRGQDAEVPAGIIVKLRAAVSGAANQKIGPMTVRSAEVAKRNGLSLEAWREIGPSMVASRVSPGGLSLNESLQRLRADPEVEYAVPDHRRHALATNPNDPLFAGQWFLKATEVSAVNAIGAWDIELGASGVTIAVLDTGVLFDHPDLGRVANGGKLLPGYDFVAATPQANDGDGRDADATDAGDWISATDSGNAAFQGCAQTNSTWHGTRVAGMVGALSNNSSGVAGLAWNSRILPVRVLGKCGGIDSDILAGMRWAAGLHVNGVADNPTPARVLNMSLGSDGICEPSYRDVINELTARKVLVVISAGNEGTVVSSPANCPGVAAVAAIRHAGSKVGFSSLGPEVTLAAPGGNCVNVNGGPCLFSLDTTNNTGLTVPGVNTYTDQQSSNVGTSFSTPIVSGIAALMLSRNSNLSTAQLLARLREGARPFPVTVADAPTIQACHVPASPQDFQLEQCLCTTDTCGAGMVDAANSVAAAQRPIAAVSLPPAVSPGQNVILDAAGSAAACGRTITSFSWSVVAPTNNQPALSGAGSSTVTILAPVLSATTLRLTVTDDLGRTDTADVQVSPTSASTAAPSSAGGSACPSGVLPPGGGAMNPNPPAPPSPEPFPPQSSGGGGGSIELLTLTLLGALGLLRARDRRRKLFSRCI